MKARRHTLILLLLLPFAPLTAIADDLAAQVDAELPALLETYRHLHANPEISYFERETSRFVAARLRQLGFEVSEEVGDYGVEGRVSYGLVAVLENGDGPTVMVRTDLDGLPIEEKTGLPWASRAKQTAESGDEVFAMHACGHDLHMTSFLGTAAMLAARQDDWSGTLVMIGQPAEERGAGARAMLADGLYKRFPRPEVALGLHTNASLAAGRIGLVPGYALANVDSVDITVRGAGGHGAYPHTTKDPVTLAALLVTNLQTIVSRQVSPLDPAVITVGSIHGGTKHNIIPDEVELQLTVRSYRPEVRRYLLDAIRRTAEETARAAGFPDDLLPVVKQHDDFALRPRGRDPDQHLLARRGRPGEGPPGRGDRRYPAVAALQRVRAAAGAGDPYRGVGDDFGGLGVDG
jgi:hippurate hydrolase